MYKAIVSLSSFLLLAFCPRHAAAQSFDTSGTPGLKGQYLFRYVNFFNDQNGNLTESCSLTGVITFDGQGKYTTTGAQLFDSASPGSCASLGGGTYGVESNGMAQLDNPLYAATLFGAFSQPVLIASSTEDFYFDLFIAVEAPAASVSNGSLSGAFTVGTLDFPSASAGLARQGYFTLNADGHGNVAAFTVTGSAANLNPSNVKQSIPASTYALSGTTGGTLTVAVSSNSSDQTQIISGSKTLFVSADGNYVLGGSPTGSDMIFGFRAPSGTSSNTLLSGTYFVAGMEDDLSGNTIAVPPTSGFLDAFYGSVNTNGNGDLIWHERYDYVALLETYDSTFTTPVTIGGNGSYFDGSTYTYLAGANGTALMLIGSGQRFSFIPGIRAPSFTASSSVWIDPVGITNAANYTPITNAYAPGELVNLYGNFGVSLQVDDVLPVPTTLNGVQVLVNGQAAPVLLASPHQVSALIPYEVSGEYFATFQVVVNGTKSNTVTVYVDNSAPGIYTLTENGVGPGAILHTDYTVVTESSPAQPGETVLLFMTGLGTVSPPINDGAAASGSSLTYSDEFSGMLIYLDDGAGTQAPADVLFAGLAPGFAGLYQVNFTVPSSGLSNGDVFVLLYTNEAISEMAKISVTGFLKTAAAPAPGAIKPRPRSKPAARAGRAARGGRRGLGPLRSDRL